MKKNNTRINRIKAKLYKKYKISIAKKRARKVKKLTEKWENNDYHFYILGEKNKHFYVGSKNGFRSTCRNYEEWKRCLLVRHSELMDYKNRQNFIHYLYKEIRSLSHHRTMILEVLTPILVAILTIFAALGIALTQMLNVNGFDVVLIIVFVLTMVIESILLLEYVSLANKLALLEDVRSVFEEEQRVNSIV